MKVCPVCNESFSDDLKFCDLDGTRLHKASSVAASHDQSKAWSLLGVALLLGALGISAASIFFFPKARVTPSASNEVAPVSAPGQGAATQQVIAEANPAANADVPEIVGEETPISETKKKDKAPSLINENANSSVPNPKAVAQDGEIADKSAPRADGPAPGSTEPKTTVTPPVAKPVSDTRDAEAASRSNPPTAEPKKDPKRVSKEAEKDEAGKKKPEDKKKGGFFRVFKKIFGGKEKD